MLGGLDFLQHRIGKLPVRVLIAFPVRRAKDRPRVSDVAQRPETLVRKSVVVAFLFFLGQPDAPQRVLWFVGRNAQAIVFVHRFAIRIARPRRDPRSVARAQDRLERSHQAARRNHRFDSFVSVHVHVRLAVRYHHERTLQRLALHAHSQALGRPHRLPGLAKPSLFLSGRARFREALRKVHHFFGKRSEKIFLRKVRAGANLAHTHLPHPLSSSRDGSDDRPLHDQNCD